MKIQPLLAVISMILLISCGSEKSSSSVQPTLFSGTVVDAESGIEIKNATIQLLDPITQQPTTFSTQSDLNGNFSMEVSGTEYLMQVSAQNYQGIPAPLAEPVPVILQPNQTFEKTIFLVPLSGTYSWLVVNFDPPLSDSTKVLITATKDSEFSSAFSFGDTSILLHNVPVGAVSVQALAQGIQSEVSTIQTTENQGDTISLKLDTIAGGTLEGQISFLATNNSEVDLTLLHPITHEVIPGLQTFTENQVYTLTGVPNGKFLANASYEIDQIVMDPDRIIKFGEPMIQMNGDAQSLDFDVTGAVQILSPLTDTANFQPSRTHATPVFKWLPYSSASYYTIEVRNFSGNVIWGGFSEQGDTIFSIPNNGDTLSVSWNSHHNSTQDLIPGELYSWKIYALKSDKKQSLGWASISMSEQRLGLFSLNDSI